MIRKLSAGLDIRAEVLIQETMVVKRRRAVRGGAGSKRRAGQV
jgi:hypothetical protein